MYVCYCKRLQYNISIRVELLINVGVLFLLHGHVRCSLSQIISAYKNPFLSFFINLLMRIVSFLYLRSFMG